MYTITKRPNTPNIIWDAENKKVLCRFEKGVIKTDDDALAKKLKAMGHTVEGSADKQPEVAETPVEQEVEPVVKPAARRTRK